MSVLTLVLAACTPSEDKRRPNIVLILADDIGVEVIGAYGGTSYETPNIDALAAGGLRFNHAYSAPVCSPSRVKLMTGRYGFRTGQTWGSIPADERTFGHMLSDAGYEVALSGKWQMALLADDPGHIDRMGFPHSRVFGWHEGPRYWDPLIYENGEIIDVADGGYGPDLFNEFILDFIRSNKDRPFFAYYPMALAHDVSNDLDEPPPLGPKGRYETFAENVEYSDRLVGQLMDTLDELGIRKNTLVMYLSDNGTPYHYVTEYRDGEYIREPVYSVWNGERIMGGKSYLTDQGTHVPFIANWPGTIEPGTTDALIDFSDFLPTLAALGEASLPTDREIDGQNFMPVLTDPNSGARDWAYQEWEGNGWIRTQRWKLYFDGRLFDIQSDPSEQSPMTPANDSAEAAGIRPFLETELERVRH